MWTAPELRSMASELGEHVWQLELSAANAFLVEDRELLLFDAGTPRDDDRIIEEIRETGHDVVDVDKVLVTHYDLDHVGGLAGLTPDLDAPVLMREPDASYFTGAKKPGLLGLKGLFQRVTRPFVSVPDLEVRRVVDGDTVGTFTVYHTPGHTQGHVAYVSTRRDVAVLGDLVRENDGRLRRSPWYLSHDTDAVRESVRTLASRAPEFAVAAVGHGDPIQTGGSDELVRLAGG